MKNKFTQNNVFSLVYFLIAICSFFLLVNCSGEMPTGSTSEKTISLENMALPLDEVDIKEWTEDDKKEFTAGDLGHIQFKFGMTTAYYHPEQRYYKSCKLKLDDGSSFEVTKGALTPPEGWPEGKDVNITMQVVIRPYNKEITYLFGPSGCKFDPPAELWLSWKVLNCANATLYYLNDEGKRIEQAPEYVDFKNKKMRIRIDHFSRYCITYRN